MYEKRNTAEVQKIAKKSILAVMLARSLHSELLRTEFEDTAATASAWFDNSG